MPLSIFISFCMSPVLPKRRLKLLRIDLEGLPFSRSREPLKAASMCAYILSSSVSGAASITGALCRPGEDMVADDYRLRKFKKGSRMGRYSRSISHNESLRLQAPVLSRRVSDAFPDASSMIMDASVASTEGSGPFPSSLSCLPRCRRLYVGAEVRKCAPRAGRHRLRERVSLVVLVIARFIRTRSKTRVFMAWRFSDVAGTLRFHEYDGDVLSARSGSSSEMPCFHLSVC